MCRSHPIFCILPPHLLQSIGNHGSPLQRLWALKTMAADNTFRSLRAALAAHAAAVVTRRRSVVEEVQKRRTISTARNEETLPGAVVRVEGGAPTGDAAVDEAYDGLGAHLRSVLGGLRAQLDRRRGARRSMRRCTTAPTTTMRSGTASGWSSATATATCSTASRSRLDVIGHELTHGVTEDEAQLAISSSRAR